MEWIEMTASTEHEALDRALDELGVHRDEAEWETLEVSKARLGGLLGRSEARVRARIKPVSREKPQAKRDRGGRSGGRGRGGGSSKQGGGKGDSRNGGGSNGGGRNGGGRGGRKQGPRNSGGSAGKQASDNQDSKRNGGRDDGGDDGRNRRGRAGGGKAGGGGASPSTGKEEAGRGDARKGDTRNDKGRRDNNPDGKARGGQRGGAAVSDGDERDERDEETVPIEEQAEIAEDFIEGLADAFEVDADIEVKSDDEDWTLEVGLEGGELGLLVGPGGATITAIEELTRTVLQRRTGGHAARVRVDVGGYKARRREALENFTRDLIGKVRESGRSQELEPMNAADRKTVHGVAADDDSVTTSSEGEEPRRRVVIHPA